MENMYPKMMNVPPAVPSMVSPAMHHPYPQVNVFDIEQKHIDNYYLAPAHTKALPMPVAAAPVYHRPRPRYSDVGIILVLYILLVIILRPPFFGGKFC